MNTRNIKRIALGAVAVAALGLGFTMVGTAPAMAGGDHETAEVGHKAPDFTLKDLDGKKHTLSEYTKQGKTVVLEWFNPDCPYVKKHHLKNTTMYDTNKQFEGKKVVWLAINSGAEGEQGAGVDRNKQARTEYNIEYPILMDMNGKVGHMYGAKTTPHMFIIDAEGVLRYNGAIDNDRSATKAGETNYVAQALREIQSNETVSAPESKPYGCSVKYAY